MDDFDFLEDDDQDEIEDLDFPIDPYDDMLIDEEEYIDDSDDNCVLDQEFIDNHLNIVPSEILHNFPFVEDDVDAITDYELFSKGFGYLDENKVNKDELSDVAYTGDYNDLSNKPDIPDVSDYVKKDTTELENYPLTTTLSSVAFSGDYDDLSDKPVIPTKTSDLTNDSEYITKNVNDLTYYTKTADLPSVPTKTSDLTNDSGFITNSVNDLTNYPLTSSLSSVAFSGDYDDLSDKPVIPTVPTNVSAFTNDAGYITKNVNDLTYYTKTADLPSVPTKTSDLTNDSGFITNSVNNLTNYPLTSSLSSVAFSGDYDDLSDKPTIPPSMSILSYGNSTWNDFITAYNSNSVVYCRASSNSNPASGSQTRLAFMAYVNNATTPTNVEFQYYRSVSTHSDSQQGDQVIVYKLDKTSGWSVITRNTFSKVVAGTNLSSSYSNGAITLNNTLSVPTKTSDLTNDSGFITNTVNDLTNYMLSSDLTTLLNGHRKTNTDADTLKTTGMYYLTAGCTNVPYNYFYMLVFGMGGSNPTLQIGINIGGTTPHLNFRRFDGDNWSSWIQII